MAQENTVQIVGTLGKDPELRFTSGGRGVCTFSVATNRKWKNKQTDEWEEETCWHNIVAWAELGENAAVSLSKGNRVMLSGRISTRSYDDKDGNKKYITEIVADNIGAELRFATCQIERIERTTGRERTPDTAPARPDEEPF